MRRLIEIIIVVVILFLLAAAVGCKDESDYSWEIPLEVYTALYQAKVPQGEVDKCLRWAFGYDAFSTERKDLPDKWNELHSDIFVMYGYDDIKKSMKKVGQVYLDSESLGD